MGLWGLWLHLSIFFHSFPFKLFSLVCYCNSLNIRFSVLFCLLINPILWFKSNGPKTYNMSCYKRWIPNLIDNQPSNYLHRKQSTTSDSTPLIFEWAKRVVFRMTIKHWPNYLLRQIKPRPKASKATQSPSPSDLPTHQGHSKGNLPFRWQLASSVAPPLPIGCSFLSLHCARFCYWRYWVICIATNVFYIL